MYMFIVNFDTKAHNLNIAWSDHNSDQACYDNDAINIWKSSSVLKFDLIYHFKWFPGPRGHTFDSNTIPKRNGLLILHSDKTCYADAKYSISFILTWYLKKE